MNSAALGFAFRTLPFLRSNATAAGCRIQLGDRPPHTLVWHPDAVGEVFRHDKTMSHPRSRTLAILVGDRSLLFLDGDRHSAYRSAIGGPLRNRRLVVHHEMIAKSIADSVAGLPSDTGFSLVEWTRGVTLRVISQILFGGIDETLLARFQVWMDSVLGSPARTILHRHLLPRSDLFPVRRTFARRTVELDAMLLRAGRAAGPNSLAAPLFSGAEPLGDVDDGEIRDQLVSLVFAGHETTASAVAWVLAELSRSDSLRHDVLDELSATTDSGANAAAVPLLDAVCKEALRHHPPAVVAGHRVSTGTGFPAGSKQTPCIYLAHHNPEFHANPDVFDPSRFLGHSVPRHSYFPFGGGIRRCLGAELAALEMRMIAATVLRDRPLRCLNPEAAVPMLRGPAMAPNAELRMATTAG